MGSRIKEGPATPNSGLTKCNQKYSNPYRAHIQSKRRSSKRKRNFIDFESLNERLKPHLVTLVCNRLLPGGRRKGDEWEALNPRRADYNLGSFKINLRTGAWADFATGDKGGDIISLWAYVRNISQSEAAKGLSSIVGGA